MKNMLVFYSVIIITLSLATPIVASLIVTDGLVSYWTFDLHDISDGIVKDVWGDNDVVMKGNPKIVPGYLKQGIKLDGLDDYVVMANGGNFTKQVEPFTFEIWFKTTYDRTLTAIYRVVEKSCNRGNMGIGICINASSEQPERDFFNKKDSILIQRHQKREKGGCSGSTRIFKNPVSDGKWHHLVFVRGRADKDVFGKEIIISILYIDLDPTTIAITREIDPKENIPYTTPIYLGAINQAGVPHSFFDGIMDEVRIYNRGLSFDEIIQNYQSRTGLGVEPKRKLSTVWGTLKKR